MKKCVDNNTIDYAFLVITSKKYSDVLNLLKSHILIEILEIDKEMNVIMNTLKSISF